MKGVKFIMDEEQTGLSFKTAEELSTFLVDMQGQISNMQETIDKIKPAESESSETDDETDDETDKEEKTDSEKEEVSEEEINEIDKLLQTD